MAFEHQRAEDAGQDKKLREHFDLAVSRAVARLSVLAEYCLPLIKKGGYFIALKGSKYKEELLEAESALKILGGIVTAVEAVSSTHLDVYKRQLRRTGQFFMDE